MKLHLGIFLPSQFEALPDMSNDALFSFTFLTQLFSLSLPFWKQQKAFNQQLLSLCFCSLPLAQAINHSFLG
jgi:hypothetical protein